MTFKIDPKSLHNEYCGTQRKYKIARSHCNRWESWSQMKIYDFVNSECQTPAGPSSQTPAPIDQKFEM